MSICHRYLNQLPLSIKFLPQLTFFFNQLSSFINFFIKQLSSSMAICHQSTLAWLNYMNFKTFLLVEMGHGYEGDHFIKTGLWQQLVGVGSVWLWVTEGLLGADVHSQPLWSQHHQFYSDCPFWHLSLLCQSCQWCQSQCQIWDLGSIFTPQ